MWKSVEQRFSIELAYEFVVYHQLTELLLKEQDVLACMKAGEQLTFRYYKQFLPESVSYSVAVNNHEHSS